MTRCTRQGRPGRTGRQMTGGGLRSSTKKLAPIEEPGDSQNGLHPVSTEQSGTDRSMGSTSGPHPSTAQPLPTDEPADTAATTVEESANVTSTTAEHRPADEPEETATVLSPSTGDGEGTAEAPPPTTGKKRRGKKPKLPKPLERYYPITQVDEECIVRWGVEVSVMEVRGVDVEQQLVSAFAGVLNALDFNVQLLIRQHPPRLRSLREAIASQRPERLEDAVVDASDSLDRFLAELEAQPGVNDRRFYAVCERSRSDELRGLISRAGFSVYPLRGRALRSLVHAALTGCAPPPPDEEAPVSLTLRRNRIEIGERLAKSLHLKRWPRILTPGYLQKILSLGISMDVSLHVASMPTAQAARTLEWQRVKMESGVTLSLKRGRTAPPEAEIALQDVARLRDEVHRGRERLFHASLSITIYANSDDELKERELALTGLFAGAMASLDRMRFRQREGHLSTMPLAINSVAVWRTLDTTSLAMLFPFSPPDLDTRKGTLFGLDLRSGSPTTFDFFDPAFLNANTVVMARSGAGKSFSTKLTLLRGISRGIVYYVIDPEGEYSSIAQAAGGRVLVPGVPGHGLNPFVVDRGDESEVLQRVGGLRRLIEVMVGDRLSPEQRATLDQALTSYYTSERARTGFHDFFAFLESEGYANMASLLRPFSTGSLRHLLTDEGLTYWEGSCPSRSSTSGCWSRS